jgi:hypothetical protein
MTVGKTSALAVAFVGAVALGVAVGPSLRRSVSDRPFIMDGQYAPGVGPEAAAPAATARPDATRTVHKAAAPAVAASEPKIAASEPKIQERLKPVLSRGTRLEMAADGFASAEQFATVAHAARNTSVPFVVLKHRVLTEKRTLAAAIRESNPAIDARAEVVRARAEARSDIDAIME